MIASQVQYRARRGWAQTAGVSDAEQTKAKDVSHVRLDRIGSSESCGKANHRGIEGFVLSQLRVGCCQRVFRECCTAIVLFLGFLTFLHSGLLTKICAKGV